MIIRGGDWETGRLGEGAMGRLGDGATWRLGEEEIEKYKIEVT